MIRLIALDFDGTIAARKQPFDETMIEYVHRWKEMGIETVVASGRPFRSLKRELAPYKDEMVLISNNGNLIRRKNSEETLDRFVFDKDAIRPLTAAIEARGLHPIFHVDSYAKGYDLVTLHEQTEREASYIVFYENMYREMSLDDLLKEDVLAVAGYTTPDVFEGLIEEPVIKEGGLTAHLLKSRDPILSLFEIIGKGSDKWRGLSTYGKMKGITPEEMIVVGDDRNDGAMIAHGGVGIAMASAPEDVKEMADSICEETPENYGAFRCVDAIVRKEAEDEH